MAVHQEDSASSAYELAHLHAHVLMCLYTRLDHIEVGARFGGSDAVPLSILGDHVVNGRQYL